MNRAREISGRGLTAMRNRAALFRAEQSYSCDLFAFCEAELPKRLRYVNRFDGISVLFTILLRFVHTLSGRDAIIRVKP